MILKRSFGRTASGIETFLYEIKNTAGASVSVTDYGARIVSINVPDRDGKVRDVLLGCDKVSDYEEDDAFLGASVGRVANRTSDSEFTLNGQKYHLNSNSPGGHTLHGGLRGFDKAVWELDTCCCQLPFHKILGYDINLLALLVDVDYYRPFTISSQKVNKIHDGMIQPFRRCYVICLIHFR